MTNLPYPISEIILDNIEEEIFAYTKYWMIVKDMLSKDIYIFHACSKAIKYQGASGRIASSYDGYDHIKVVCQYCGSNSCPDNILITAKLAED
jgi:hypothetical protein